MAEAKIDNAMTCTAGRPLEGTASMSVDESGIVVAKYEGGEIAAVGGKMKVSFKCQVLETQTAGVTKGTFTIGTTTTATVVTLSNAQITYSPGWNSTIGFVTDVSVVGEVGS